MKFVSPWLRRWKMGRIRIEIKTSIGRFGEKGGYIMKEEMQKKLFYKIVLVTFFLAQCTFKEIRGHLYQFGKDTLIFGFLVTV